nr:4Fe-4S dicluster domain-containing protein [Thermocrinis albus]
MIRVNLELCIGCRRCMMACSFMKTGGFNPRYSSLIILTDIGNKPEAYLLSSCESCKDYVCVEFCSPGAIEYKP